MLFKEDLSRIRIRPMIKYVRDNLGGGLVGVEVGVAKGNNALSIMKNLDMKTLFLVDPYVDIGEINYRQLQCIAFCRLEKYYKKLVWVELPSNEAVHYVPDGLDFVYLDGCHEGVYVLREVKMYWDKLRVGGVLGGHDFNKDGVCSAVKSFCDGGELVCRSVGKDWWLVKK